MNAMCVCVCAHVCVCVGLRGNVERAGYARLTAVQRQTIPAALEGRDLLVQATTGAGKCVCVCVYRNGSLYSDRKVVAS